MEAFKPLIAKVAAGAELTRAEAFDAFASASFCRSAVITTLCGSPAEFSQR